MPSVRDRLAEAAFDLFDERGYAQTTVDDLTERAGLGRTTFFRHYRSKEDVIFPDHDRLLEQVGERLRTSSHGIALAGPARPSSEGVQAEAALGKEPHEHATRIAPPLVIQTDEIDWALERIQKVLTK